MHIVWGTLTVSIGVLQSPEKRLCPVTLPASSLQILLTVVKLAPGFNLIKYLQTTAAEGRCHTVVLVMDPSPAVNGGQLCRDLGHKGQTKPG